MTKKETEKTVWKARYNSDLYDDADYCNGEFFGSQQEALDHYYKLLTAKAEDVVFDTGKDCESEWQVTVCPVNEDGNCNFDKYENMEDYTRYYHHLPAADVEFEKGKCEDPMLQRNVKPVLYVEKKDGKIKSLKMRFVDIPKDDDEKHEWIERYNQEYTCRWCGMTIEKKEYDDCNGDPNLYGRKCSSYGDKIKYEDDLFKIMLDKHLVFEKGTDTDDHCWELIIIDTPTNNGNDNKYYDYIYKCRECGLTARRIGYVPSGYEFEEITTDDDIFERERIFLEIIGDESKEENYKWGKDPDKDFVLPESVTKMLEAGIDLADAEKLKKIIAAR